MLPSLTGDKWKDLGTCDKDGNGAGRSCDGGCFDELCDQVSGVHQLFQLFDSF